MAIFKSNFISNLYLANKTKDLLNTMTTKQNKNFKQTLFTFVYWYFVFFCYIFAVVNCVRREILLMYVLLTMATNDHHITSYSVVCMFLLVCPVLL